jgi:hypothetical protein
MNITTRKSDEKHQAIPLLILIISETLLIPSTFINTLSFDLTQTLRLKEAIINPIVIV